MLVKLALPEIRELIAEGDEATLREALDGWLPPDLGELLGPMDAGDRVRILRLLGAGRSAETFAYLDLTDQREVLDAIGPAAAAGPRRRPWASSRTRSPGRWCWRCSSR